jgi:secondary thiamine-phosphate synthase enzyme
VKTKNSEIKIETQGFCSLINITDSLDKRLQESKLKSGLLTVICSGSTGGITTCEYEPGLIEDLKALFERLIPQDKRYAHDERWGDGNGFSHLRASLIGPSLSVPFKAGRLILGTWQQVVFIDFDNRPRSRKLYVQLMGE